MNSLRSQIIRSLFLVVILQFIPQIVAGRHILAMPHNLNRQTDTNTPAALLYAESCYYDALGD